MRAPTIKQGLALAFGKYRYGIARRGEGLALKTEQQKRLDDAETRGNTICWKCDVERDSTVDKCKNCGADCTPF